MGISPVFWRWLGPVVALLIVIVTIISYMSLTQQQKRIIRRAKAAGVSLDAEDQKRIDDLAASKERELKNCVLLVVAMAMFTMLEWGRFGP